MLTIHYIIIPTIYFAIALSKRGQKVHIIDNDGTSSGPRLDNTAALNELCA